MSVNYDLRHALNNVSPATRRLLLGNWVNKVNDAVNYALFQTDINSALANATVANASGTVTAGGSVAAGNTWTLQFVNASVPALVTPGITLSGTAVTGETLTTLAAKIAVLVQANAVLRTAGVSATSAAAVLTVRQPGVLGNTLVLTSGVSASLTLTVVQPASGTGAIGTRGVAAFAIPLLNTLA